MDRHDEITIGELAARSGLSVPTIRFYEARGLIGSRRTAGNQRRFPRHTLRRLAVVRAGQTFGITLEEIAQAFDRLPPDRPPTKADWSRVSRAWHATLTTHIEALTRVRDGLEGCIGCGCLSLRTCPAFNPQDVHGEEGPGARRWPPAARA